MALAEQRRTRNLLGEVLISLGFISEQTVSETVSAQTGIPYVRVTVDPVAPELLKMVPEDVCRRHRLVPLGAEGSVLRLAMANPFDVVALDYIRTTTGLIPFPSIAPWGDILKTIERHFSVSESFDDAFEQLIAQAEAKADDMDVEEVGGPLVELVDQIIVRAVEERGTDIHIEPEENIVRIRYRIDGVLVPGPMVPKKLQFAIAARIKVMAGLNVAENRVPQASGSRSRDATLISASRPSFATTARTSFSASSTKPPWCCRWSACSCRTTSRGWNGSSRSRTASLS
jgi:type IV pilus assembly protein PilB